MVRSMDKKQKSDERKQRIIQKTLDDPYSWICNQVGCYAELHGLRIDSMTHGNQELCWLCKKERPAWGRKPFRCLCPQGCSRESHRAIAEYGEGEEKIFTCGDPGYSISGWANSCPNCHRVRTSDAPRFRTCEERPPETEEMEDFRTAPQEPWPREEADARG